MLYAAFGLLATAAATANAASWTLSDTFVANDFMDTSKWNYSTGSDPTQGLVVYQSAESAKSLNLTRVSNDLFYMGVSTVDPQLEGRPSVRINSQNSYSDGVYVLNATHMPSGCSTWPAWWTVTADIDNWPAGGEIDIMENANDQYTSNLVSLHTEKTCVVPKSSSATGVLAYPDCGNADYGCRYELNGTSGATAANTGPAFNKAGGGIYAMERALGSTGNGIRIWFWPQGSEPSDLKSGSQSVDPSNWGNPAAEFGIASECASQFGPHQVTFDVTLGGNWAATTYNQTDCANTYGPITSQVAYNGSSYDEAYWAVDSVRVFAQGGSTDNAANSQASQTVQASAVAASNSNSKSSTSSSTSGAVGQLAQSATALVAVASLAIVGGWTVLM